MHPRSTPVALGNRTREQLLEELIELRARVAVLEKFATKVGQLESVMRRDEEMSRRFLEQMLYGAWVNVDGKVAFMNRLGAKILGASDPHEIVGKSIFDIIHPDYHDIVKQRIQTMLETSGAVPVIEEKLVGVDGRIVDVDLWAMYFIFEGRPAIFVGFHDISERKRAEEALSYSERLYRAIGESIDYGVWVCAPDGRNIYASESFLKLVGLTQEQCSDFGWGDVLHPDDAERTIAAWKECVRTEGKWDIEHRYRGVDGNYYPILARGVPVRDEDGKIMCWAGINLDIGRLKHTEEELNTAKAQAELYLDLMSHDINNMHQAGIGYLELALAVLNDKGRIEIVDAELMEKSMQAMQDSTRLIENVRKLRSAQSKEYQLQPIDLREVLEGIKEQFSNTGDMRITVNYTPTDGCILATGLVKDVFANIVGNAVKHSDPDKPLEINITQLHVYGTDESYYKVIIEDDGPGIPDELKTRIFNRFERGNTKAKGKGLGLYLVKTLVHGFHGKIWVEDRVQGDHKQGARFVVIIPAVEK